MPFYSGIAQHVVSETQSRAPNSVTHIPMSSRLFSLISDIWMLSKPEINVLIAIATFTGFYLGQAHRLDPFPLGLSLRTIIGTLLVASGAGTLNQYIERRFDGQMRRTARRPLAGRRIRPSVGLVLGIAMVAAGSIYLARAVNLLASELAVITLLSYLLIYTPLKRKSPICTLIGALPGAMPVLIGWAGASGGLSSGAWILFGILFLWQFPHFMAIAWMYREDYERAGYYVLPKSDSRSAFVNIMTLVPLIALLPLTVMPSLYGSPGSVCEIASLLAGSVFLYFGGRLAWHKSNQRARHLLFASIAYLPALF